MAILRLRLDRGVSRWDGLDGDFGEVDERWVSALSNSSNAAI